MSKIIIRVNNETGKLIYWCELRKLGLPGRFSLIPVSEIEQIVWTYPPKELTGSRGCGILTVATVDTIYSYSFFADKVQDVEEIIRQVHIARRIDALRNRMSSACFPNTLAVVDKDGQTLSRMRVADKSEADNG